MSRGSPVWKLNKDDFAKLVRESSTLGEILQALGMAILGSNYNTLKKRIYKEEISIEHIFEHTAKINIDRMKAIKTIPIEKILVANSIYNSTNLRKRLYKEYLLKEQCSKCGIGAVWNNEKLSLHLDHINGNHMDNRLENLRILCPNCHSQTGTFGNKIRNPNCCIDCNKQIKKWSLRCHNCNAIVSGKRLAVGKKRYSKQDWRCLDCSIQISRASDRCKRCAFIFVGANMMNNNTKIQWPDDDKLLQMVLDSNFVQVGKQLGVSDNAIRKRLKRRNML